MENPAHREFADYVARRGPVLLRTARRLAGDPGEAEDLLQAALTRTYLAWDRIHDRAALDGYVRRAMVNIRISWWRRRRLDVFPTADLPEVPVEDCTRRSELSDCLQRALRRLSARQRTTLMLRYYEDLSETEVAARLGVSVGTVKSTVSRAVARLRDDIGLGGDFQIPSPRGTPRDRPPLRSWHSTDNARHLGVSMRLRSVLLAVALLPVAACGGGSDGVDKKTSCDRMKSAISSIGALQAQENGDGPGDFAKIYSDAATQIRTAANTSSDAGAKAAGVKVADALDQLAKAHKSGDASGSPAALEASGALATAAGDFEKQCGPVTG